MRPVDGFRLMVLSAIWGFSFLFMRVLSPRLGAILTADLRLLLGGGALVLWFAARRTPLSWREHGRHYVFVGLTGNAIPFLGFTFAARHIPAGYSAIVNASSPLFGALFATLWLGAPFTAGTAFGLFLGLTGVALVANVKPAAVDDYYTLAILACLMASVSYGISANYIRKLARHVPPAAMAAGSQFAAGLLVLPLLTLNPAPEALTLLEIAQLLALALLCSSVAYLIYYRLVADIGATRALTVTFLVPLFGMLWAWLFLGEPVTATMLAGCALVIAGTWGISRA